MNALPTWESPVADGDRLAAERAATARLEAAALTEPAPSEPPAELAEHPDSRRLAVARALIALAEESATAEADLTDAVERVLAAVDAAHADAGVVRVNTSDVLLHHRITRIVSGATMPSRGPATRAREILALLLERGTA